MDDNIAQIDDDNALIDTPEDEVVLTTKDNPFNPKTAYVNWKTWDERAGYNTEAYVARVANIPLDIDLDDDILIGQFTRKAYQVILDHDVNALYQLV